MFAILSRERRASAGFTTFVVSLAIFTDVLIYGLVVPVLPFALADRVKLPHDQVQRWNSILLATYGGAIATGSILFGWVGDAGHGRQMLFVSGLTILASSTLVFALSTTLSLLLVARILQGMSTAIVFTVGFALLQDKVGKKRIGQAMGWTSLGMSSGLFLGPIVGGFMYELGGYFAVFVPAFGLIAMEVFLRLLIIEDGRRAVVQPSIRRRDIEADGHRYGTFPDIAQNACRDTWSDNATPSTIPTVRSPHLQSSDRAAEQTSAKANGQTPSTSTPENPITSKFPILVLLRSPRLLVAMWALLMLNSFSCSFESVLPTYAIDLFGMNSLEAALLFISITIPMLFSPLPGRLVDRVGTKYPATGAFAFATPGLLLLRLVTRDRFSQLLLLVFLLVWFGCAFSLAMPAVMTEVSQAVEAIEERSPGIFGESGAFAQAYGLTNSAFAIGAVIGPLYAGYARIYLGWPSMTLLLGILSAITTLAVFLVTGGPISKRWENERNSSHSSITAAH